MKSKIDEIREVVNKQSKVIKILLKEIEKLKSEILMMKNILGYDDKTEKMDVFFKQLEKNGVSKESLLKGLRR